MKSTPQEWQTARIPVARSTRRRDETTSLSTATSLACVPGYREARDRLVAELEGTTHALATDSDLCHGAARRKRSAELAHPLEASLDWLIPAVALAWATLGILSL